jgi:hypothetical protein
LLSDDKRKETKDDDDRAARPVATATQSSKPKAALEKTKNLGKLKADVGGNDEDDSEQGESDDDEVSISYHHVFKFTSYIYGSTFSLYLLKY